MSEDILKKVKKLLALASSCNAHEAEVASAKAQALMVKHNLSMQSLGAHSFTDYVNECASDAMGKISRESSYIMNILTQHFFVRCYYDNMFVGYTRTGKRSYKKIPKIVGTSENVAVAQYVYKFLMDTYQRLWKEFAKTHHNKSLNAKNSFFVGLTFGIKETLKANEKKVSDEMGLVIVPDAKLNQFMKATLNLKSRAVGALSGDGHAQAAGHEAGKKVRISRALENESSNGGRLLS